MSKSKNTSARIRLEQLHRQAAGAPITLELKPLAFVPGAKAALMGLGQDVMKMAGAELTLVQLGEAPTDFKPVADLGAGTYEIRLQTPGQWIRVFYVAKFEDAIYVLDAMAKTQNKIEQVDKDKVAQRYKLASELSKQAVAGAEAKSAKGTQGLAKPGKHRR